MWPLIAIIGFLAAIGMGMTHEYHKRQQQQKEFWRKIAKAWEIRSGKYED